MGGQAAEQIIAGVVLGERLAVTTYGALHRAQFAGQRNLRGLAVDPKLLADDSFRIAVTDAKAIAAACKLDHPCIVQTVSVESSGRDVVVVTRGGGRYVSVQDLITTAKSRGHKGGKLPVPVAGLIGKSVIEALAAAHGAGVIHGAVHPSSVIVDEDGNVQLGDFVVGRALTSAIAQGADSSLWRGLAGYIAPELVVGEDPTPAADVFAIGAMLFTMLSGTAPPGALRSTPAVERLVQRALDTDISRRYKSARDLLENLLEAMEDDRWQLADKRELVQEAGLAQADAGGIDDATEDLLASLGSPSAVQVQRPSADLSHLSQDKARLDTLLADLGDEATGMQEPPRKRAASAPRVPSLDDPDEVEHTPPPRAEHRNDELAAMAAITDLEPSSAPKPAPKLPPTPKAPAEPARAVARMPPPDLDVPPPKLKSPLRGIIGGVIVLGALGGGAYYINKQSEEQNEKVEKAKQAKADDEQKKKELEDKLRNAQPDPGALEISSPEAGVWLRLGRTPLDTPIHLSASQPHDLVLLHDGNDATEAQVNGPAWSGANSALKATLTVALKPSKAKKSPELPLQPTTPVLASTGVVGAGPVHVDSTPSDAEVWLFLGANRAHIDNVWAGRDYELAVVRPGYKTQHVTFKAEDWRDGGDPNMPIDVAKKKPVLSRDVQLEKGK